MYRVFPACGQQTWDGPLNSCRCYGRVTAQRPHHCFAFSCSVELSVSEGFGDLQLCASVITVQFRKGKGAVLYALSQRFVEPEC